MWQSVVTYVIGIVVVVIVVRALIKSLTAPQCSSCNGCSKSDCGKGAKS